MTYEELLKTIPQDALVVAIQCQHDTDVDETCSIGRGISVSNFQYYYDYDVEKFEYVQNIKTLSKTTGPTEEYMVHDWKEGGYVVYIRPDDEKPKTLVLKGINFKK